MSKIDLREWVKKAENAGPLCDAVQDLLEQGAGEVTELRAALWHIKNTAIALSDAQVIALEALAAYEAKKAGQQ